MEERPQVVTRHGEEVVVVVPAEEYRRTGEKKPDFKEFLFWIWNGRRRCRRIWTCKAKYLLDTSVISEARKPRGDERVKRWISSGIGLLEGRDPVQAEVYEAWLAAVLRDYADRIIPVDAGTAEEWGRMNVPCPVPVVDSLMAATATVKNMTFVTRNTSDVARTGARFLNPFESSG